MQNTMGLVCHTQGEKLGGPCVRQLASAAAAAFPRRVRASLRSAERGAPPHASPCCVRPPLWCGEPPARPRVRGGARRAAKRHPRAPAPPPSAPHAQPVRGSRCAREVTRAGEVGARVRVRRQGLGELACEIVRDCGRKFMCAIWEESCGGRDVGSTGASIGPRLARPASENTCCAQSIRPEAALGHV